MIEYYDAIKLIFKSYYIIIFVIVKSDRIIPADVIFIFKLFHLRIVIRQMD